MHVLAVSNDLQSFSFYSAKEGRATQEVSSPKLKQLAVDIPFMFTKHVTNDQTIVI